MIFFFKFELSLKDNFNSKPLEIYYNLNQLYILSEWNETLQNGIILFGSYVMTQNVDTGNLKISQRKSLVE